ncbi:MAG: HAMP domain-containing histidine kinase [Clostridia bacterium]|nr:HAMP domain-containing histidine kinase [Clostridia bacterium]MCI1999037.1 HAMP domain-containing histidine kinase [Clostridia bacterium]MCI2013787.1 HAMP domain-containing histidine kinase [Clostridia bacterium]
MKADKVSIKWKLIGYMVSFVAMEFILLNIFQVFFLDSFYKKIKVGEIKNAAKTIVNIIDDTDNVDYQNTLKNIARESSLSIEVFDSYGNIHYSVDRPFGIASNMTVEEKNNFFTKTKANGGSMLMFEDFDSIKRRSWFKNIPGIEPMPNDNKELSTHNEHNQKNDVQRGKNLIYSQIIEYDNKEMLLLLCTAITPLGATSQIISVTIRYANAILLVFSILLAFVVYRKISKPIMMTNSKAKLLAEGNYNISFNEGGYREISQLNKTLDYAASELSKTEQLQRDLIANISHDLRTPLTMIRGYAEVMRDIPGENSPENIQTIIDETNRLSNLVTDILDISKLQSGVTKLNLKVFSITDSIKSVIERYEKFMGSKGYNVVFEYDKNVYVNADDIKITQVLYNLINNAIKYTGNDKKVIIRQTVDSYRAKIEVVDTGEGIDEEEQKLIWDKYYKAGKNHKRSTVGTGLGLSIVKNIFILHGLKYGVESKKGSGSTFYFYIDAVKIENVEKC